MADTRQFITFDLDGQTLAIDVMAIREIRAWSTSTLLPNAPTHVCGVVNLRGVVLPVIDLRQLLGWGKTVPTERQVIIVVHVNSQMQGVIVDGVNDIVAMNPSDLQPPPDIAVEPCRSLINGIATIDDRMVMVLALDCISAGLNVLPRAA